MVFLEKILEEYMTALKSEKQISEGIKKNQSLRKALQILEGMTKITTPARLQDIAQSLNMPQSTLAMWAKTLILPATTSH